MKHTTAIVEISYFCTSFDMLNARLNSFTETSNQIMVQSTSLKWTSKRPVE